MGYDRSIEHLNVNGSEEMMNVTSVLTNGKIGKTNGANEAII